MNFENQLAAYRDLCEGAVKTAYQAHFPQDSTVAQAAGYSLLNGGKRVRGVLVLASCQALGGNMKAAEHFAAGIEMVHAFSLVHDDLPCMDDDDMRRGKPSAHIAYGEATALLAGDALALQAFSSLAQAPAEPWQVMLAVDILAGAAGSKGMILGQELDLKYETVTAGEAELAQIQTLKTGALFEATVLLGAAAAGKRREEIPALLHYADCIGRVFQIVDDILDVTANPEELGKPVGSDSRQGKSTYVSLFGLDAARQKAEELTQSAVKSLQETYGFAADFLVEYANILVSRVY